MTLIFYFIFCLILIWKKFKYHSCLYWGSRREILSLHFIILSWYYEKGTKSLSIPGLFTIHLYSDLISINLLLLQVASLKRMHIRDHSQLWFCNCPYYILPSITINYLWILSLKRLFNIKISISNVHNSFSSTSNYMLCQIICNFFFIILLFTDWFFFKV